MAIFYIVLVSALFGWALFHRTRERRMSSSSMTPLLNYADEGEINNGHAQKDEMKVLSCYVIQSLSCWSSLLL